MTVSIFEGASCPQQNAQRKRATLGGGGARISSAAGGGSQRGRGYPQLLAVAREGLWISLAAGGFQRRSEDIFSWWWPGGGRGYPQLLAAAQGGRLRASSCWRMTIGRKIRGACSHLFFRITACVASPRRFMSTVGNSSRAKCLLRNAAMDDSIGGS